MAIKVPQQTNMQASGTVVPMPQRSIAPRAAFGVAEPNATAPGQGLQNLGQGLQILGQKVAETQAEEALLNFRKQRTEYLFNPDNGYFNSRGRDAYDRAEGTRTDLEKMRKQYSDALKGGTAQSLFDRAASTDLMRDEQDILRHSSAQAAAWEANTMKARTESALTQASRYWQDSERLGVELQVGREALVFAGRANGDSAEVIAQNLNDFNTAFYSSVVESAVASDYGAGQAKLDEFKEYLPPIAVENMQKKIDLKVRAAEQQNLATDAIATATVLVESYKDQPDARDQIITEVNKIENPELREMTMQESMQGLDRRQRAQDEEQRQIEDQVIGVMNEGGSVTQYIATNAENWQKLTEVQKARLMSLATNPTAIETDIELFYTVMQLPQEDIAKLNVNDYLDKFSRADLDKLQVQIESARRGEPQAQIGRTRAAQVSETIEQIYGKASSREMNNFHEAIDAEVKYREATLGKQLNSQEFTQLLNDMTKEVTINRPRWFDSEYTVEDIPDDDMMTLVQKLHEDGLPVTSENLIKLWDQVKK